MTRARARSTSARCAALAARRRARHGRREEPDPRRDGAPARPSSASPGSSSRSHAQFLAAIQLIVYAGAVVVLFVFVIMLLGPERDAAARPARARRAHARRRRSSRSRRSRRIVALVRAPRRRDRRCSRRAAPSFGTHRRASAASSSRTALVPFELSSALLMVAVVGAVAVARGKQRQADAPPAAKRRRSAAGADAPRDAPRRPKEALVTMIPLEYYLVLAGVALHDRRASASSSGATCSCS